MIFWGYRQTWHR